MSCREFLSLFLDAWLAGELPARRAAACSQHCARCVRCRGYADEYRGLVAGLAAAARRDDVASPLADGFARDLLASWRGRG